MKYFILLSLLFIYLLSYRLEASKILWWFDTYDSSFGQTAMDDIDGDGKYELVFGCYRNDSTVYALNSEDGSLLWKYNTTVYQEGCNDVAPLIYDINDDGFNEVVVPSSCNPFTYCFDGKTGEVIWRANTRGSDSPPTVADFNNDGILEILHGEFGGYVISINSLDGSINDELLVDSNSWIQTSPTILDINNDNQLDFVVSTWNFEDNNKIYAFSGNDFTPLWQTSLDDYVYHGSAIVDIDSDGEKEIIFGDYSGKLYVINSNDGSALWTFNSGAYIGSPVSAADINSDGYYELFFCSGSRIICLNYEGELLWEYDIPEYKTSFRGVVISDIIGNHYPEIIFGTSGGDLIVLNSITGVTEEIVDLEANIGKEFGIDHAPVVGDFNQNGLMDVFVVGGYTEYPDFYKNYGRAYAIEFEAGNGPDWKMFQNNIHRTCAIEIESTSVNITKNKKEGILVYPNPVFKGNSVTIFSDDSFETIEIYNIIGQKVFSDKFYIKMEIDCDFTRGLYYVNLIKDNKINRKRFVVQ